MEKKERYDFPTPKGHGKLMYQHASVPFILLIPFIFCIFGCSSMQSTGITDMQKFVTLSRTIRAQNVTWEKAVSFTFDRTSDMEQYRIAEGKWEIRDGKLWAFEGDRNRAILLTPCRYDPVRIEFEATNWAAKGLIGDITVLLNSTPDKNFFGNGYALTTVSYWNNCTSFYKRGLALANTNYTPVKSGKTNHIALEFNRGHITYWMNGEILLEAWDETPLVMDSSTWIGIRTWSTRMCIDNVVVYRGISGGKK